MNQLGENYVIFETKVHVVIMARKLDSDTVKSNSIKRHIKRLEFVFIYVALVAIG